MKRKSLIAGRVSIVLNILAVCLFLLLCWTAAADAQGAIALFLYAPVLALLVASAFFLGRAASKETKTGLYGKRSAFVLALFLLVFYLAPAVGLNKFSTSVVDFVARSFKALTGKTPYESDKNL